MARGTGVYRASCTAQGIAYRSAADGERAEWTGRLAGSDEVEIRVEVDGEVMALAWSRVQAVHHVLEW